MPEGDTVWLAGQRLHRALVGRPLLRTDLRVPQHATADLSGRLVLGVASRGKHLLMPIEGGVTLHTHFQLDGAWHIYPAGKRWRGPNHQVRVVLENADHVCVGFRLAVVELIPTTDEASAVGHLGPDLLAADWGPVMAAEAAARLAAEPTREIGNALLDQRNLAGLGNVWRCEVLFLRGIHPYRRAGEVTDLPRLIALSRRLLWANRERPEQSATGSLRRAGAHYVYSRRGLPCRRCRTPIQQAEQGEGRYARVTFWCPRCQPS